MSSEERDNTPVSNEEAASNPGGGTQLAEAPTADEGKLPQKVDIKDAGPCRKHVKVTVERAAIDERFKEKYKEIIKSQDMQLRGFRPGKAPRQIVERRFAKEVGEQVKTEVLMASLQQLADEANLSPLSAPDINPDKIEIPAEGPMIYEFEVEVRPEFDLPPYKGLKLRRPIHSFSDAEVQREKRRLLEEDAQIVPKENEPAAMDDKVVADIIVKFEGQTINELKDIEFRVDKRLALSDGVAEKFDKAIIGAKIGETRPVEIKLSDALPNSVLRGKTVQAEFTLKDIKTYRYPEIDQGILDEFEVQNEDQLDELIRGALERRLEYTQRNEARKQILEIINDTTKLELPRDMLKRQAQRTLQRRIMEMRNAGIPDDQIRGRMKILQQDVVQSTSLMLKEHFVLQRIAEEEKIEITEEDIDAEIERLAMQTGESPRKVRAQLEKDDLLESVAADLLERKALDLVLGEAVYEDYQLNPEESEPQVVATEASAVPESSHDQTEDSDESTGATPSNP